MQTVIQQNSHAVVISANDGSGPFRATYYVNVPKSGNLVQADITNVARKFATLAGAQRWAFKELGAARETIPFTPFE